MAKAFCQENGNGYLYNPDESFKKVVEFANIHFVEDFYVGITDDVHEDYFQYFNGTKFPNHLRHFWKTGEPNNYIPMMNRICESDGEDYVIARRGKLEDVRGLLKFPFICQNSVLQNNITSLLDICTACRTFVWAFNLKFNPLTITHLMNTYCEKNSDFLQKYVGNICGAVSNFGFELIQSLNDTYVISNEICHLFQNCNQTQSANNIELCNSCKFLVKQVKIAVLQTHDSNPITKQLPILQKLLPYICKTFGFDCSKLNFLALLKRFFSQQLDEDTIHSLCIAFEQC